jgi:hypothetical protein
LSSRVPSSIVCSLATPTAFDRGFTGEFSKGENPLARKREDARMEAVTHLMVSRRTAKKKQQGS